MRIFTECMSCFFDQINRAIRLLSPNSSEDNILTAQQKLMQVISEKDISKSKNHEISAEVYRIIGETLNMNDPFKDQKNMYNRIALDLVPQIKEKIRTSKNQSLTALLVCILGNSIDYGAPHEININRELKEIEKNNLGGPKNVDSFFESLRISRNILILGDNAGEIVFDKIFIETILEIYPNKNISYSVRKGPIINDATMEDALYVNITKICDVVESSATAGISMETSTPEFIKKFNSADLILSKGQGNFESMLDIEPNQAETYFLLKTKCLLMERIFSVPSGTLLLVKKDQEFVERINSGVFRQINRNKLN